MKKWAYDRNRYKDITKQCQRCGNWFATFSWKEKHGRGKYCSNSCKGAIGREAIQKIWNHNTPKASKQTKLKANYAVQKAIRAGQLIRPEGCSACGRPGNIHAHHDDYAKPLDIRWLCKSCHSKAHHGTL